MEDINCWESKFERCLYSDRLLNRLVELNKLVKNPVDLWEVKKACYYAKKYHGSQVRQSGEPYYSHPIEVAYQFAEYVVEWEPHLFKDLLKVAILHDVIEDTELTESMIEEIFDQEIASQVDDLTRIKLHGKISSADILKLFFIENNFNIALIKMFDRIHNLQTLNAKSPEKAKRIIDETLKSFLALSKAIEMPLIADFLYREC